MPQLLHGVREMKESVTYQAILNEGKAAGKAIGKAEGLAIGEAEGRVQEARQMLLRLGTKRFGKPSDSIRNALEHIAEIERLERLSDRLLDVATWDELFERN
jgi:predicted transposase YdaD